MNLEGDKRLNLQLGLDFSSVPTGEARQVGRDDRRSAWRPSEATLAGYSGAVAERDLRTETGEAGGNPEAGCRRGAKAWHPNRAGSLHPASGDAGAAEAVEPDVLPLQLWVSTASVGTPSRGAGAAVHRGWLRLGD